MKTIITNYRILFDILPYILAFSSLIFKGLSLNQFISKLSSNTPSHQKGAKTEHSNDEKRNRYNDNEDEPPSEFTFPYQTFGVTISNHTSTSVFCNNCPMP